MFKSRVICRHYQSRRWGRVKSRQVRSHGKTLAIEFHSNMIIPEIEIHHKTTKELMNQFWIRPTKSKSRCCRMNRCTNSRHFWQITNLNKVEDTRVVNRHQNFLISIQIVRPMSMITLSSISSPSSNRSNKCIFQICWMRISNRNRSKCSYSSQPLPQIW